MDLNKFGKRTYECALKRGKIHSDLSGVSLLQETVKSLTDEVSEVASADEMEVSEHLPQYSSVVEELVDVAIVTMTELYRRGVDINSALHEKMKYNEQRY